MTEQRRSEFLAWAHTRAYAGLRYYMRSQYCFGDEDWDKELEYIEGSYMYSVWNRLYDAIFNTRTRSPRYDSMTREDTIAQIKKYGLPPFYELEKTISQEEFDCLISMYFETKLTLEDVVKSAIEDYYKDKVSYTMLLFTCKKHKYPTTLETVVEDTIAEIRKLNTFRTVHNCSSTGSTIVRHNKDQ